MGPTSSLTTTHVAFPRCQDFSAGADGSKIGRNFQAASTLKAVTGVRVFPGASFSAIIRQSALDKDVEGFI
jgi:hypothetical protein